MRVLLLALGCITSGCTLIYGDPRQTTGDGSADASGTFDLASDLAQGHPSDLPHPPDLAPTIFWNVVPSGTTQTLYSIWGCGGDLYAVGAGGTVLYSAQGGAFVQSNPTTQTLYAVSGSNCTNVYAVGQAGTNLYASTPGTFTAQTAPVTSDLYALLGTAGGVIAAGASAVYLHSPIGAPTWTKKTIKPSKVVFRGLFSAGSSLLACGDGGALFRSTDSGVTFNSEGTSSSVNWLGGFASTDGLDVYLVGAGGKLLHSTTGGAPWPAAQQLTTTTLTAVFVPSTADVYVVGLSGLILHSTDRGATFTAEGGTTADLFGLFGTGPNDLYAVGQNGTILHRP